MSEELVFYTNPMSRGRIVRWMLEEVGEPYRTEIMPFSDLSSPEYLAINPMGKVPAITHGHTVITETAAICAYLADAFPEADLAPAPTDPARGAFYRWLFFGAGCIEPAVTNRSLGFEAPAEKRGMVGYGSMDAVLDTLEEALIEGPYLLGQQFTAADVYIASQLSFGTMFGTIEKRPAFMAYLDQVMNRPAAIQARDIDDAIIAEQKAAED